MEKAFFKAGFFLLFIICSITVVLASDDNGGYIVTPTTGEYPEGAIVDHTEADGNITFWDLPLWIQVSVISGMLIPVIASFKYFPILLGKLIKKKENAKLRAISSYIKENPGCFEAEISKNLDIKRGTLRHYLGKLIEQNLISTIRNGKIKNIFPTGFFESNEQKRFHLHLKNDTRKIMLNTITEKPGITGQELASELALDKSTIHWHISKLLGDDIVRIERDGRFNKHYLKSNSRIISDFECSTQYEGECSQFPACQK
ncbi:winged helix-turn-helix transcriptional regulator [Methanolobus profundi]|uniref:Predicted transcriptional regulator, containsd two HTH domains n=1 Tax=Methanolobus profundi TaxID=487685 RepID=A0A1I4P121_9EURY|nr:winged helix-turn-helix transcriptional regulator [Methanolobus profundi]SFM21472.1 Predicted transcriptional regulator, containsd two HTH domains [Methanolobus profundi]